MERPLILFRFLGIFQGVVKKRPDKKDAPSDARNLHRDTQRRPKDAPRTPQVFIETHKDAPSFHRDAQGRPKDAPLGHLLTTP